MSSAFQDGFMQMVGMVLAFFVILFVLIVLIFVLLKTGLLQHWIKDAAVGTLKNSIGL